MSYADFNAWCNLGTVWRDWGWLVGYIPKRSTILKYGLQAFGHFLARAIYREVGGNKKNTYLSPFILYLNCHEKEQVNI